MRLFSFFIILKNLEITWILYKMLSIISIKLMFYFSTFCSVKILHVYREIQRRQRLAMIG